jgi:uroporphyrinogen-III synthase
MRILVTRPLEDGREIAARLAEMGHQALLAPLLAPVWQDGPEPDFAGVQAILATSANGIRALVRRIHRPTSPFARSAQKGEVAEASAAEPRGSEGRRGFDIFNLPIFAVGPQTMAEARAAGFADIRNGDGDASDLAQAVTRWTMPDKGALLHVCGAEAPGTLAEALEGKGFSLRRSVLYRVEAAHALPPETVAALQEGALDAALFFSPRSARLFCELAAGLPTQTLAALCISPATAAALAPGAFGRVAAAARPNQASLLALLA